MKPQPDISVVIPSYKPGELLGNCLDSVLDQSLDVSKEVIVVDSSPESIGKPFRIRYPRVTFVHLEQRTLPGRARNIGASMTRGKLIFFTDIDCVADRYWMEVLWEAYCSGYSVVGGSVVNGTPKSRVGTAEYFLEFSQVNPERKCREVRDLPSNNLAVDRGLFQKIGGFPDFMKGEDTIFCDRALEHGSRILFQPDARITHINRTGLRHFLKNQIALGEGSNETRRRTQRPGTFLIDYPFFIPLILPYRTWTVGKRIFLSSKKLFMEYLAHYPFIFFGLLSFTWGFIRGSHRSGLSTERPKRKD